jgi:hypothetical protein
VTSLTRLLPDLWSSYSWRSPLYVIPELRLHQIPELRRFLIPWTSAVSNYPEMDIRFVDRNLIQLLFRALLVGQQSVRDSSGLLHECFLLARQSFPPRKCLMNLLTNSANPTFRGCKVFAQSPNREQHFCSSPQLNRAREKDFRPLSRRSHFCSRFGIAPAKTARGLLSELCQRDPMCIKM